MARNWTEQQKRAMLPANRLTVLSAAAGSGKTTVLVERALRLLLDEEKPVSADKMLIVTFSNASAAEFRARIEKGINEKIRENPRNNFIKMQKVALQKADISTIHSFCIKLVRENFQSLDISPDFTIADNAAGEELHNMAIDRRMNYGYNLPDFKQLVSFYGKSSHDRQIREFLRQMNYFFSALPHPDKNAALMAENYGRLSMKDTPGYNQLKNSLLNYADYLVYLSERMDCLYQNSDFEGYEDGIITVKYQAVEIHQCVLNEDFEKLADILSQKSITLGRAKPRCEESNTINKIIYSEYKDVAAKMADLVEFLNPDMYAAQTAATEKYVQVLFRVYAKYAEELLTIKKERKIFEFSDFEHFALQLLQTEDGRPTPLAENLRRHYEYIMEDEFQDTSYVQDAIFTMIAREGQSNLYVVGDVKQSIYGFRKASPEIFLQKRQIGLDDSRKGNTIYLPHNFRSAHSVIEGVNYLFTKLMSAACGGVEYDENERLQTLKNPDENVGLIFNIYNGNEVENTVSAISRMIKDGYEITDGDTVRPVHSGDFCILMRNKSRFPAYKAALEKRGYEAFVRDDRLILEKEEVAHIINLLRVVANPLQEVYLTAAMFGDIFGFSADEILKIRIDNQKVNLYKALALSDSPKAVKMLEILKDLTYISQIYSADKLIDHLCRVTGYYGRIAFSADGTEKRENIRRFIDFARNWAATHPSNLAGFIRRIDIYIQSGGSGDATGIKSDKAIAIMTMHTSKGLEFPVVFVPGLRTKFNISDSTKRLLLDTGLGIGMYANTRFGYNNSTMNIHAIKEKVRHNSASEEMRLLYVAFTRSKNLLVLSGEFKHGFSENSIAKAMALTSAKPHPVQLQRANMPVMWVLSALAGHPALADNYSYGKEDRDIPQNIQINIGVDYVEEAVETAEAEAVEIAMDMDKLWANLEYVYPHRAKTKLPIKLSVSEIAKSRQLILAKPDFINKGIPSAAEKGTAMHLFAQHADIERARIDLQAEISHLANTGKVDTKLLNIPACETFVHSAVADMILTAETVYREKDFLVPYSAALALNDDVYKDDEVMVQGVMDRVLENGGEITIIDYKTDFVHDMKTLYNRYEKQLELYRYGAKQVFQKENVKCLLYSFHLGQWIEF